MQQQESSTARAQQQPFIEEEMQRLEDEDVEVEGSHIEPPTTSTRRPQEHHYHISNNNNNKQQQSWRQFLTSRYFLISLVVIVFGLLSAIGLIYLISVLYIQRHEPTPPPSPPHVCRNPPPFTNHFDKDTIGIQHSQKQLTPLILRGATLLGGGFSTPQLNMDILIQNGKIVEIQNGGQISLQGAEIIHLAGRIVTPGLVDLHSHLGVYSFPTLDGTDDGNEMTNPVTVQVRAVDALNPKDLSITQMLEAGVTTAQVLPGSANVMGGEGVIVKTKGYTVSNMLLRGAPRALKMACGENPKRVYGTYQNKAPGSRMGSAWVMRQQLEAATKLKKEQDAWDCDPVNKDKLTADTRPSNLSLEPLVGLLRGDNVVLNVHCYEVQDLEMAIRLSKEFGFTINAFHHALEAYLIADMIKENNITVATFSDLYGYKTEAFHASVDSPKILHKAGVPVVIKSDHPVTHAKDLLFNAAKAFHFGMDAQAVLDSVTTKPADALKLSNRIGYFTIGNDADLVVWDRHPLAIGAQADKVIVDGKVLVNKNLPVVSTDPTITTPNALVNIQGAECYQDQVNSYAIRGAQIRTMDYEDDVDDDDDDDDDDKGVIEHGDIVVQNGTIVCLGDECAGTKASCEIRFTGETAAYPITITPGLIHSSTTLGLMEIQAEASTIDGTSTGYITTSSTFLIAKDGVRMKSRPVINAFNAGITSSISHRMGGKSLVAGISSMFYLSGEDDPAVQVVSDALIKEDVALNLQFGVNAKESNTVTASISGQVAQLRTWLTAARKKMNDTSDYFVKLIKREIPAVVEVNQADDIGKLLELQKTFQFNLVIIGGAEAHLLVDRIKQVQVNHASLGYNIGLVLTPFGEGMAAAELWDTLRATDDFGAAIFFRHGVQFALGAKSDYDARQLRWFAGLVSKYGRGANQVSMNKALSLVTRNVISAFGLKDKVSQDIGRIKQGAKANFVVYDANPVTLEGTPKIVALGKYLQIKPKQQ